MQLIVIDHPENEDQKPILEAMLRLRARVFAGRLNWDVDCRDGLERDRFDDAGPAYIVAVDGEGSVVGCVRLLSPMRSSMLNEVFPELLAVAPLQMHPRMIESSRFCIDRQPLARGADLHLPAGLEAQSDLLLQRQNASNVRWRTRMLLAGIVEWSLAHQYDELVTATDIRFERVLAMVGWPLQRLGPPRMIGETQSVAGLLPLSRKIFDRLKPEGYRSLLGSRMAGAHENAGRGGDHVRSSCP
jgi:acyl homoserine lactone synthase